MRTEVVFGAFPDSEYQSLFEQFLRATSRTVVI